MTTKHLSEANSLWQLIPQPEDYNIYMPDLVKEATIRNFSKFDNKITNILAAYNANSLNEIPDTNVKDKCVEIIKYALFRSVLNGQVGLAEKSRSLQLINGVTPGFSGYLLTESLSFLLRYDANADRAIALLKNKEFKNAVDNLDNRNITQMATFLLGVIYVPRYLDTLPVEATEIRNLIMANGKFRHNLENWCKSPTPEMQDKSTQSLIQNTKNMLAQLFPETKGALQTHQANNPTKNTEQHR